jgi:hypothetical protein
MDLKQSGGILYATIIIVFISMVRGTGCGAVVRNHPLMEISMDGGIEDVVLFYLSHNHSQRVSVMNAYIRKRKALSSVRVKYFFVDSPANLNNSVPRLSVSEEIRSLRRLSPCPYHRIKDSFLGCRKLDANLLIRAVFSVDYFLKHTNARWFVRMTDDTLVNFAKLGSLISQLEARYHPLTDFVFKGHCIDSWNMNYAQGGSGYLLSRYACEQALKHSKPIIKESIMQEDISIGQYIIYRGFPPTEMCCGGFIGHPPDDVESEKLRVPGKMETCRFGVVHAEGCGEYFERLNEVVFVHPPVFRDGFLMSSLLDVEDKIFHAADDVFWWNGHEGRPGLCRWDNLSMGNRRYWDSPRIRPGAYWRDWVK